MSRETDTLSRQRAQIDLQAIKGLRSADAFNHYYLRRLKEKRDKLEVRFRTEPATKINHEEREILRRIIQEYDQEIIGLMDSDEAACRSTIESGSQTGTGMG